MGKVDGGGKRPVSDKKVCQVDGCSARLNTKGYHQRYRVCQQHLAAESVLIDGVECRFCQQCGRFEAIALFDDTKRSCRARLAHHNSMRQQRRREAATAQLLERNVPDLPRSSRPSAARTPGAFCSLLNSPDHFDEEGGAGQHKAAGGRSSSSTRAQSTAAHAGQEQQQACMGLLPGGNNSLNLQASAATAGLLRTRSQGPSSGQVWPQQLRVGADSSTTPVQHSRWTEETALAFFTHASRHAQQQQQQQQQERALAPLYRTGSGAALGASASAPSQALMAPVVQRVNSLPLQTGVIPYAAVPPRDVYDLLAVGSTASGSMQGADGVWGPAGAGSSLHGHSTSHLQLSTGSLEGHMQVSTDSRSSANAAASSGVDGSSLGRGHSQSALAPEVHPPADSQQLMQHPQRQLHHSSSAHGHGHVHSLSASAVVAGPAVRAPNMSAVLALESGSSMQHRPFAGNSAYGHAVTAMHGHVVALGGSHYGHMAAQGSHVMGPSHTAAFTSIAAGFVGAEHSSQALHAVPPAASASAGPRAEVQQQQQQMLAPPQRTVMQGACASLGLSASQHSDSQQPWGPQGHSNGSKQQLPGDSDAFSRLGSNSSSTTHNNMQRSGSSTTAQLQQDPAGTMQQQQQGLWSSSNSSRPQAPAAALNAVSTAPEGQPAAVCLMVQPRPAVQLQDAAGSDDWELQWTPSDAVPEPSMGLLTPGSNSPMVELLAAAGHDELPLELAEAGI